MWGEETSEKAGKATDGAWHGRPGWEAGGGRREVREKEFRGPKRQGLAGAGWEGGGRGGAGLCVRGCRWVEGPGACGLRDG